MHVARVSLLSFGTAVVLLLPFAVTAAPLNYSHVDLDYYNVEIDGTPVNDEGVAVGGRAQFTENFYFTGRFADTDDLERISAGLGAQTPIMERTSWFGELTYEDAEARAIGREDEGFGVATGLRHALFQSFEVNGAVQYLDVEAIPTFDQEVGYEVGALYSFTEQLGVKAAYNMIDDYEGFTVGGRFDF